MYYSISSLGKNVMHNFIYERKMFKYKIEESCSLQDQESHFN